MIKLLCVFVLIGLPAAVLTAAAMALGESLSPNSGSLTDAERDRLNQQYPKICLTVGLVTGVIAAACYQ